MNWKRIIVAAFIFFGISSYFYFGLSKFFDLNFVKTQLESIQSFNSKNFKLSLLLYFVIYSLTVALSIPGAVILTLIGGAVYGVFWGTLVASFASSIGATLAFFVSRILLRDWVLGRFGKYFEAINRGIEREGVFYLFALRMVPLFPFFAVNLLMGLTTIRATSFYIVSQIGMLLGTVVYVNAGSQLATINNLSGIVSPNVVLSLACVGLSPLVAKYVLSVIKREEREEI